MRIHEHDFENQDIVLDFHQFDHCTFTNCLMIVHGYGDFQLSDSNLIQCRWEFAGPAANAIKAMTILYHGGAKELIDQTFKDIRSGTSSGDKQSESDILE